MAVSAHTTVKAEIVSTFLSETAKGPGQLLSELPLEAPRLTTSGKPCHPIDQP